MVLICFLAAPARIANWQPTRPGMVWEKGTLAWMPPATVPRPAPLLSDASLGRDALVVVYGAYVAAEEGRRVDLSPWFAAAS